MGISFGLSWRSVANTSRSSSNHLNSLSYHSLTPALLFPQAGRSRLLSTSSHHPLRHPIRGSIAYPANLRHRNVPDFAARRVSPQIRFDSTTSPSTSLPSIKSSIPPTITPEASAAPTTSLLARITSTLSLTPVETPGQRHEAGHGSSSVAKLVELAKPEGRQLSYAVGLVSLCFVS